MEKLMFYVVDGIKEEIITTGLANNSNELNALIYKLCDGLDSYYLNKVVVYYGTANKDNLTITFKPCPAEIFINEFINKYIKETDEDEIS